MVTKEPDVATSDPRSREFEQEIAWERAARMLDLDRSVVRRLRNPRIEWVTHHECASGAASLYGAASRISNEVVATVHVGSALHPMQIAAESFEVQMQLALADKDEGGAAIGLQIPSSGIAERELFELARQCAPVVSRTLGAARLMPVDTMSTVFASWMASVSSIYGARLTAPCTVPKKHLANEARLSAEATAHMGGLALEETGKKLRGARVTVAGLDAVALECMRMMQESGIRIVAFADESGGLVSEAGIEIPALLVHIEGGGLAAEYCGAEHIVHAEALALPADLLLTSGRRLEITESNARSVSAPIVIETAPGSVGSTAQEELSARGVMVLPHPLIRSCRWNGLTNDDRLGRLWSELSALRKTYQCPLSTAVLLLILQRLAERERLEHPWQTL